MSSFLLGIDGGGTGCRAAVATTTGRILGRGRSGAANILTDPDTAVENIVSASLAALNEAALPASRIGTTSALLGVAGSNVGDAVRYVKERLPFARADIEPDGLIALNGALGHADGAVAILGTGTIYVSRRAQKVSYIGGWGFQVGDLGSGARLGHALLQESLLAFDRVRPSSPLTDAIMAKFHSDPREIVEFARSSNPGDFGHYAPMIFDYARRKDPVAVALIRAAARTIDDVLDLLVAKGTSRLCLLGGLGLPYQPWLADRHRSMFVPAEADALTGAVTLAIERFSAMATG